MSLMERWSLDVESGACVQYFQAFLARGMAVISVDVRGTGASFGQNG
jgi:predicted acyl esterase